MTLVDNREVSQVHRGYNYFIGDREKGSISEATSASIQELNTLVTVSTMNSIDFDNLSSILKNFTIVIVAGEYMTPFDAEQIDATCRSIGIPFFFTVAAGLSGFLTFDLGSKFVVEDIKISVMEKSTENKPVEPISRTINFPSFSDVRSNASGGGKRACLLADDLFLPYLNQSPVLKGFEDNLSDDGSLLTVSLNFENDTKDSTTQLCRKLLGVQFAPLGAVLGGLVAQEVIKAITHERVPHGNAIVVSVQDSNAIALEIGFDRISQKNEKELGNDIIVAAEDIEDLD